VAVRALESRLDLELGPARLLVLGSFAPPILVEQPPNPRPLRLLVPENEVAWHLS
jgi:hypothetical protein